MGKTALLFAGQGAQFVGMGRDLAENIPACRELFQRASGVLGYDLARLCFEGPIEALTRTDRCQPAIFTVSAACVAALRDAGVEPAPAAVAGLSLGEWTALYYAGAIGFEDTLRVLEARGRAMQAACDARPGAMLSVIGMTAEALEPVAAGTGVQIANINSAGQVVLSGPVGAIARASEAALRAGARKTIPLKVAGAYHSALMKPAADELAALLGKLMFRTPSVPVLANVTGLPHGLPGTIAATMVAQVVSSVRWDDNARWMLEQGITTFVECGPGQVLGGLMKRLDSSVTVANIQDLASLKSAAALLAGGGTRD